MAELQSAWEFDMSLGPGAVQDGGMTPHGSRLVAPFQGAHSPARSSRVMCCRGVPHQEVI